MTPRLRQRTVARYHACRRRLRKRFAPSSAKARADRAAAPAQNRTLSTIIALRAPLGIRQLLGDLMSLAQELVDVLHAGRAFADCGSHALDASHAHVPDREDSGQVGLERMRISRERPFRRRAVFDPEFRARAHEPFA